MAEIDSIVSVEITADSRTVSRQGFGVPLVLSYHTVFADQYRAYSSISEMSSDGFTSKDEAYRACAAIFAQDPTVDEIIVGRLPSAPSYNDRLQVLSATEGQLLKVTYLEPQSGSAIAISRTIPAASTLAAEATALAAQINAVDVDSIKTNLASTAGIQSLVAADFDGVIGDDVMTTPYRITFTFASHPDWDATNITLAGLSPTGAAQSEQIAIPNGGNATVTSTLLYKKVTGITVPAQSGTGGTGTVGTRAGVVATVASSVFIDMTALTAGRRVHCYALTNLSQEETTADAAYDTELSSLELVNDDWYFVIIDSSSPANVADVAAWVLPRAKLYFSSTNSAAELAGTGTLGSDLSALSNDRTVLLWAPNSHEYAGAAYVGTGAPQTPGSITWCFRQPIGVTPKQLSTTQKNFLEEDNINHLQTVNARGIVRQGVTTIGEFIDIRHGLDALSARMKEDVYELFVNSDKVPFTNTGLDMVASVMLAAMRAFEGTKEQPGLIAEGTSQVIMPDVSEFTSAEKALRRLTGVRFSGTLEGAIHGAELVGTLST